jgi:hypothetical protein
MPAASPDLRHRPERAIAVDHRKIRRAVRHRGSGRSQDHRLALAREAFGRQRRVERALARPDLEDRALAPLLHPRQSRLDIAGRERTFERRRHRAPPAATAPQPPRLEKRLLLRRRAREIRRVEVHQITACSTRAAPAAIRP